MCGIAGIFSCRTESPTRALMLAMAAELHHRGPDGVGLYLDEGVGLVNTRLSIIDLAGGDQPIGNENGRFWAVQNGEIYNHIELRQELEALGHSFSTHSDTEVIVHAFEEWGEGCLARFNGPFAFAVWDRLERRLFLARDRFGVRPLFLSEMGDGVIFASEAKAILCHPKITRVLDPAAITEAFTLWAPLPARSAFRGIRELGPGCWMRLNADGRREERRWWDIRFAAPDQQRRGTEEELAEELDYLMQDAIRLRLRSDVPVAAYLSGGLDSSTLVSLAREQCPDRLRCFGIGFHDARFDESLHQRHVAAQLGVDLEHISIGPQDIAKAFPEVVALAEKPLLRTAPAPMLLLAGLAGKSGFKVVLTGEGADELFAGYDIFRESQIRRFWARNPQSSHRPRLFERLYPWLTRSTSENPAFARGFFGNGFQESADPLYSHRLRFSNTRRLLRFLDPSLLHDPSPEESLASILPEEFHAFSDLAKAQYLEITTFLHGYLLHSQGDRMLMGRSVEGRFPFLDPRVAEFAATLPDGMRLRGLKDKRLLRRMAGRRLPEDVTQRPKRPYRAPIISAFLGAASPDYVRELFDEKRLEETGLFQARTVRLLWEKCQRNLARGEQGVSEMDEMAFVGILSVQLLHEQLIRSFRSAPVHAPSRFIQGDREMPID